MTQITQMQIQHIEEIRKQATNAVQTLPEPIRELQDVGRITVETETLNAAESDTTIIVPKGIAWATRETIAQKPEMLELLSKHFAEVVQFNENKWTALHYATAQNFIIINIPKGFKTQDPILIKKIAESNAFHHVLIIAQEDSHATIIEEEISAQESKDASNDAYMSTVVEIIAKKHAQLTYTSMQNYSKKAMHFIYKKAQVRKDAQVNWVEGYFGAKYTNSTVRTEVQEQGGQSTNTTIFFGNDEQRFDVRSQTVQKAKHTHADMQAIGVVRDKAKSMCNGLIKIEQEAFSSQGHQRAKTLLMNRNAQANAIPSMEIDNFDVRATHEASVGQLDKKKIFYLMSRGLSEEQARIKIVEGFFTPIIDNINNEHIRKTMHKLVQDKLKTE